MDAWVMTGRTPISMGKGPLKDPWLYAHAGKAFRPSFQKDVLKRILEDQLSRDETGEGLTSYNSPQLLI